MIPTDKRYPDHDCGKTVESLKQVAEGGIFSFSVNEVKTGDLYCSVLNEGFFYQIRGGMDYTMNLSHGVLSYVTEENVAAMLGALEEGALVTGLAINEFEESILQGRILNTCSIWENKSWTKVGGYAVRSRQPRKDDRSFGWLRDTPDGGKNEWSYATGVEEMIPLINLVRDNGPCLAPIMPKSEGTWDIASDRAILVREHWKISTKHDRQTRVEAEERVSPSFLARGIMPKYRNQYDYRNR